MFVVAVGDAFRCLYGFMHNALLVTFGVVMCFASCKRCVCDVRLLLRVRLRSGPTIVLFSSNNSPRVFYEVANAAKIFIWRVFKSASFRGSDSQGFFSFLEPPEPPTYYIDTRRLNYLLLTPSSLLKSYMSICYNTTTLFPYLCSFTF